MTPLRQRMLDELQLRGMAPRTQDAYVDAVARLAKHHRRSPDENPGNVLQTFQQFAEEFFRRLFIAARLYQDIENFAILIHRPTQVFQLAVDRQVDLVKMPVIPGPGRSGAQSFRIGSTETP